MTENKFKNFKLPPYLIKAVQAIKIGRAHV